MGFRSHLSVPSVVLATGRYAPAVDVPGSTRPSGMGLTGTDLQLWWTLLDAVDHVDGDGVVTIPQTALNSVLGRVHPSRLEAALERLRGTDLLLEALVVPLVVEHARRGVGKEPRVLVVRVDRRLVDLVRSSIRAQARLEVRVSTMRELSSRWSLALYGRFLAWTSGIYPDRSIRFGRHPKGRAFELDIPGEHLQDVFAFAGVLRPFEVSNFFVTSVKRCPLKRELERAGIAIDTTLLTDEIFPARLHGLRLRISEIVVASPVADVKAGQRHAGITAAHWRGGR